MLEETFTLLVNVPAEYIFPKLSTENLLAVLVFTPGVGLVCANKKYDLFHAEASSSTNCNSVTVNAFSFYVTV